MADNIPGDSVSKISGLRRAVKCFYEALATQNTDASCGSTPNGGNGSTVQLRFGFVPYAPKVNVGNLLPNNFLAAEWRIQSRQGVFSRADPAAHVAWEENQAYTRAKY